VRQRNTFPSEGGWEATLFESQKKLQRPKAAAPFDTLRYSQHPDVLKDAAAIFNTKK
jgi:hypothetical protein